MVHVPASVVLWPTRSWKVEMTDQPDGGASRGRTDLPLLAGKRAVVFGGGGSIGRAVARRFAAQGANVFLSGVRLASVEAAAEEISAAGGCAHAAVLDALDPGAVGAYIDAIVREAGGVDIAFNATGPRISEYRNGTPALEISADEFMVPVSTVLMSQFITAITAARPMVKQRSGVVIFLTGSPARPHGGGTAAISAAFGAVEVLTRALAIELGPAGVRAVCVRTAANSDSRTVSDIAQAAGMMPDQIRQNLAAMTMLGASPTTGDTASVAAFVASDQARMLTGTVVNASGGAVVD
jgi:3-oxoacyl-[acyl-carrier protein] reductase